MSEAENVKKTETVTVTWRMPTWVANEYSGDWTGFRETLDKWVQAREKLDIPELPDETTSVCLRVSSDTLDALEKEAKRLSKHTRRKWTAGKVARTIYENLYENPES